jgi:hypothetical protein
MKGGSETAAGLLVRDVVREIVSELAPHEVLLLDGLLLVDDDTALRRLSSRRDREPLGFGLGEAAALVTPLVWMALDEAARRIVSATVAAAGRRARGWLRRIGRRSTTPRVLPPLTPGQLEAVRLRVAQLGVESGMDDAAAEVLAERVVARLVLSAGQQQDGEADSRAVASADDDPRDSPGPDEEDRS